MPEPTPEKKRKCPGEKYAISVAICRARQAKNYPKCLLCPHHEENEEDARPSDPRIKSSIFRASTIAGQVPDQLNDYVMRKVGTAAAQCMRAEAGNTSSMAVGHDLRANSAGLARAFGEGVRAGGLSSVDLGPASPELVRFALGREELDVGAFISACHAGADLNGVRFYRAGGEPVTFENGLDNIGLIARRVRPGRSRIAGDESSLDPRDDYRDYVLKFAQKLEPFEIAVEGSRGFAGGLIEEVFSGLPVKVRATNCRPDPASPFLGHGFPSGRAEKELRAAVRSSDARMGIAVDFDGDLCAFCDEEGRLLPNDVAAALIGRELLKRIPRARIAYDLRFSEAVREEIVERDGQPLRTAAGPLALSRATLQKDAVYAADLSGRHFFRDMNGAESPVLALLMMCSALSRSEERLSRMAAQVSRYSHSGRLRYQMPSAEAAARTMEEIKKEFSRAEQDSLDGLTCRMEDWWFNLRRPRGSTTLRLVVEGRSGREQRRGRQRLERLIQKIGSRQSA